MKNSTKNIVLFLLIFLLAVFTVVVFFLFQEKKLLQNELSILKKEVKFNNESNIKKNKELITISKNIQKKNDSLSGKSTSEYKIIDGIKIGDKPITLEELIYSANKYINENSFLKDKLHRDSITLKNYNKILKKLEEEKVVNFKLNDKMEGEYSYMNLKYYETNKVKKDSLLNIKNKEISNYKNELVGKNSALNLVKKYYGIDSQIEIGEGEITTKLINTEKIDSALWIYPYYKHKIKTNKKGETIIK